MAHTISRVERSIKQSSSIDLLRSALAAIPVWLWFLLLFGTLLFVPTAPDLEQYYKAAAAWPEPLQGSPLEAEEGGAYYGIYLPWTIPLFLPLVLIPKALATALVRTLTVIALHWLGGKNLWKTMAICASVPGALLIYQGNLDALSAVGALLPGAGAVLLLSLKPQAAALAIFPVLLRDGWKQMLLPLCVIALATVLWPEWLFRITKVGKGFGALEWSLFPLGLPFGLLLLARSLQRRDPVLGALATPLVTPFMLPYSLAPTIALLFRRNALWGWALWVISWVALLYIRFVLFEPDGNL